MNERKGFEGDERVLDELRGEAAQLVDPDNRYTLHVRGADNTDLAEGSVSHAINKGRLIINGAVTVKIGGREDDGKRRRTSDK